MIFTPPLPLSQTVTLSQTPSPLWSVTYFMDGPYVYSILYTYFVLFADVNNSYMRTTYVFCSLVNGSMHRYSIAYAFCCYICGYGYVFSLRILSC